MPFRAITRLQLKAGKHAVDLNHYDAKARGVLGMCHFTAREHAQALEMLSAAPQLSPNEQDVDHWAATSAFDHFLLSNYDAALSWTRKALYGNPGHLQVLGVRAALLAELARSDEAASAAEDVMAMRQAYRRTPSQAFSMEEPGGYRSLSSWARSKRHCNASTVDSSEIGDISFSCGGARGSGAVFATKIRKENPAGNGGVFASLLLGGDLLTGRSNLPS